nr:DDE-type integrase/transposase/recombinase [Bacteroidota bacterium]
MMVQRHGRDYKNELIYSIAGISRQGYFKQKQQQKKQMIIDDILSKKVAASRKKHPRMGSRSMYHQAPITEMGINKFEQWMSANNLTISVCKRRIVTTLKGPGKTYPNLIEGIIIDNINQVVAGDITYYQVHKKTYYIFTLKDLYSKRLVGIVGSDNLRALNSKKALRQFFKIRKGQSLKGMIHHTDAGSQYKASAYLAMQHKEGIRTSMAENCLQNGTAEQLNDVLKNHYLMFKAVKGIRQFQSQLAKIVKIINEDKPVEKLGYLTPIAFEKFIMDNPNAARPKFLMHKFDKKIV